MSSAAPADGPARPPGSDRSGEAWYDHRVARMRWGLGLALIAVACGGSVESRSAPDGGAAGQGGLAGSGGASGSGGVSGSGATCGVANDPCGLPPDAGDCDGAFPSWYFNAASAQCEAFTYGGCGGNANRFQSIEECQNACAHRADKCFLCNAAGSCVDHDCAPCPGTAYCSGEQCDVVGLACMYLPACGAITCTCKDDSGEVAMWECIPNTC